MVKYCKCGCGEVIEQNKKFSRGHNRRGTKPSVAHIERILSTKRRKGIIREQPLQAQSCACGCGYKAAPGATWVNGHFQKAIGGMSGKVHTEESKRRSSISNSRTKGGKKNARFHPYLLSYELRNIMACVISRDGKCVLCSSTAKLSAHHVVPVRVGYRSKLCDHESNLITLCSSCHSKVENGGDMRSQNRTKDKWKQFLSNAFKYLKRFGYSKLLLTEYRG